MERAARAQERRCDRAERQLVRAIDDMRDQIRANTEAVLRMLDRFSGGGAAPATG